jgi:hypothetical protein
MENTWDQDVDYEAPVLWGVVLYQKGAASHGTILKVTPHSWEIAGTCPVQPNMTLKMRLWPGYRRGVYLEVEEATVLWVKEGSFGVTLTRVRPRDEAAIFDLEQKIFSGDQTDIEEVQYC